MQITSDKAPVIMAQRNSAISDAIKQFIEDQKMFFVATATASSRVNLSPKGMESLRVLDKNRIVWLHVKGSNNETCIHVQENPRMTLMFNSFGETPMILRLYGTAAVIHEPDPNWEELLTLFAHTQGVRQLFDMKVELVQTSCSMGMPVYRYVEDRL